MDLPLRKGKRSLHFVDFRWAKVNTPLKGATSPFYLTNSPTAMDALYIYTYRWRLDSATSIRH